MQGALRQSQQLSRIAASFTWWDASLAWVARTHLKSILRPLRNHGCKHGLRRPHAKVGLFKGQWTSPVLLISFPHGCEIEGGLESPEVCVEVWSYFLHAASHDVRYNRYTLYSQ